MQDGSPITRRALRPGARPLPPERVAGPGRDARFRLPQFEASILGARTAYFDAGAGTPLVFIHGLVGNVTHWVHVAPPLARRARVIGLDLPGSGESAHPPAGHSVTGYADHVAALLDHLGVARAVMVGHSLGGMVCAELALRHPGRCLALALVDPAGLQPVAPPLRAAGRALLRPAILEQLLPRAWRAILGQVFFGDTPETRAFIEVVARTYDPRRDIRTMARIMGELRADIVERHLLAELPRLHLPVGLIWGAADRLVPAAALRDAAARLPHVTLSELPRCGHMPNIERPRALVAFLARMLRAIEQEPGRAAPPAAAHG